MTQIGIKLMRKTGISHKHFKAPFAFNESKRTKSSLPDKLTLYIIKKKVGEDTDNKNFHI